MDAFERLDELLRSRAVGVADAIVLLAGDRYHRIPKTVELYKKKMAPHIVITSNADNWDYGSLPSSKLVPELLKAGVAEEHVVYEETAPHTRAEADSTLRIAKERGWKRLILVTTGYHRTRAFLTWLSAKKASGSDVDIFLACIEELPDFKKERADELFQEERERIRIYQEKGDVASYEEGIAHVSK